MARTTHITTNHTCWNCGWRVHRLLIGYAEDGNRHQNFDRDPAGAWVRDPISGHMRRIGIEAHTDLDRYSLHRCHDEAALD